MTVAGTAQVLRARALHSSRLALLQAGNFEGARSDQKRGAPGPLCKETGDFDGCPKGLLIPPPPTPNLTILLDPRTTLATKTEGPFFRLLF